MKNYVMKLLVCLLAVFCLWGEVSAQTCLSNSPPPALTPTSVHFNKSGGVATVLVSVAVFCSWSATTGAPFIHPSDVGGNLQLNVDSNPDLAPRSGSVLVTSTPFGGGSIESVTQDAATGDFSIAASPSSQSVVQASSTSYQLTISRSGGFIGNVSFKVSGLPNGVSPTFPNGAMNLTAAPTASLGTFQLIVSGTNGNVTHTTTVSLTVLPSTSSLSVSLAGSGSGTVTSSPTGINCASGTCSANFANNLSVSLTAISSADSVFVGWSGGCSGTGPCTVSMSQNQNVTATFALSCVQSVPIFADFNGDGKSDLLWLQADNRSFVQLATGTGNFANYFETNQSNSWGTNPRLYLGDFNGDGKTDLLWLQSDNNSFVQLATGSGNFANYFETNQSNNWGAHPRLYLGDFNGDGKTDLLWLQADGRSFVQLATGTGNFANYFETNQSNSWGAHPRLYLGDFNGDGKTDLLWLQANGRSFVQLATASGNFANSFETNQSNSWGTNPRLYLGDFNGDGKTDLLWLQADGRSFVQLATGTGNFANYFETNQSNSWGTNPRLYLGDFNGDGKTDLLWLQSDNNSFVQLATGSGNFANYFETNQSNSWGVNPALYLGDFNGDGKTDLLWLQSDNNSFVQLAEASGNFANYFETNQSNSWGTNPKLFTKLGPSSGCLVVP